MDIVSVLVPLHNNEDYIESALNSLLLENPQRIELLVLNDGSTDGSLAIAESWLNEHHNVFYKVKIWSQINKGISATLNDLVSNSSGKYLTILPADDELLPGGIDVRIRALKANPQWLCVFGDARIINSEGKEVSASALFDYPKRHVAAHSWALLDPKLITLELIIRWSVPGPVFLAHRKTFQDGEGVGCYDEGLAAEDRDYYLRLLAGNLLGFVDSKVANYRVHASNVSTNIETSYAIRNCVFESEQKNLELFSGLNYFALYAVYRYKKSISRYIYAEGSVKKVYYLLQAVFSRIAMRLFDVLQRIRAHIL